MLIGLLSLFVAPTPAWLLRAFVFAVPGIVGTGCLHVWRIIKTNYEVAVHPTGWFDADHTYRRRDIDFGLPQDHEV